MYFLVRLRVFCGMEHVFCALPWLHTVYETLVAFISACVCMFRCRVFPFAEYIYQLKETIETAEVKIAKYEAVNKEKDGEYVQWLSL